MRHTAAYQTANSRKVAAVIAYPESRSWICTAVTLKLWSEAMAAVMKPKLVTVRRKKIVLQIEREKLGYHFQKGWHLEVPNAENEMVEATPKQIDEMLSP